MNNKMKKTLKRMIIIQLLVCSVLVSCQEIIETRTQDERLPLVISENLKEINQWSTIYIKFDATCLQRKVINNDKYGEIITYYFELSKNKYIFLRHSTYKDFDAFDKKEKMTIKTLSNNDIENIKVIDLDFILDNGLQETYFTIRDKNIFLIDESEELDNEDEFLVYEVVLGSSYDF